jgi:ABC-type nitrate/sulfonate/bicarbonate transport system permease component
LRGLAQGLWLPVAVLGAWQVLATKGILNPLFFPAPTLLAAAGWDMVRSGELGQAVSVTLTRMLVGSAIGMVCGVVCGLAMGVWDTARRSLGPVVSALNSTPKLALMPLLLIFTGVGETARLVPIAATCFIVVAMNTLDAVRGINHAHIELARNYGASGMRMLRRVYLPASLPQVFTGLRVALGRALVITISVELLGSPDGLGNMIWMGWQTFSTEKLYVGLVTTALAGVLVHAGLGYAEQRCLPWRQRVERA